LYVEDCIFVNNSASPGGGSGGGIYFSFAFNLMIFIKNCYFSENTAATGGKLVFIYFFNK
jgi:hypothetical protein